MAAFYIPAAIIIVMILIDTSVYIEAVLDNEIEKLLENLSGKIFIQSCDVIEEEIHDAIKFLRKTDRKQNSEKLSLIHDKIREGSIRTTERIVNLAKEYHNSADLSKRQNAGIENDFLIVASASVAGVKNILSLNRKTMASVQMVKVYAAINPKYDYNTPKFLTTKEELIAFLKPL